MKKIRNILTTALVAAALIQSAIAHAQTTTSTGEEIRPFKVHIPQADLDELRSRVLATKFPEKEIVNDHSQGVQSTQNPFLA